jgi:hypothetical protein
LTIRSPRERETPGYLKLPPTKQGEPIKVAAARKLACAIWYMLSHEDPYRDAESELSERKVTRLEYTATSEVAPPILRDLELFGERLREEGARWKAPLERKLALARKKSWGSVRFNRTDRAVSRRRGLLSQIPSRHIN